MGNETANTVWINAMRGDDIDPRHRSDYDAATVIRPGGGRSQNIGCIHACNDLYWSYHHDQDRMHRVFTAWLGYAGLGLWMTTETYSQHVYQAWILDNIARVVGLASKVGREDVAHSLLPHLRTARAIFTLSAGWRRYSRGPQWMQGYPVTMCGSRSFASGRNRDGTKRDERGRLNPPWEWMRGESAIANHSLMMHLHYDVAMPEEREFAAFLGADVDRYGLTPRERKALRRILRRNARERHYLRAVDLINAGPAFAVPAEILRTDKGVAFVALKSIAPGSTSFCYSRIWHEGPSPNRYWRTHHWPMGDHVDLVTADTSMRTHGKSGRAQVELVSGGYLIRAQRKATEDWTDTKTEMHEPGWFEQKLAGSTVARIRLNARGPVRAEVLELNV